jgi:hypothetical protein
MTESDILAKFRKLEAEADKLKCRVVELERKVESQAAFIKDYQIGADVAAEFMATNIQRFP